MSKQDEIRALLKDNPELSKEFENILQAPRERNEIYMYCMERETLKGKKHFVPMLSFWGTEPVLMACNDVKILQEDYKDIILQYGKLGHFISIIEVPFWKYVEIHNSLSHEDEEDLVKRGIKDIKMLLTLTNSFASFEELSILFRKEMINDKNYCKCLDSDLNIVQCDNYKPLISSAHHGL